MFKSINPATGQEIATHAELTPDQIETKLNRAASAFASWRRSSLKDRAALLQKLAATYEANKERLAFMATAEMGKTYTSAIAEVEKCISAFSYYAQNGASMLEPINYKLMSGNRAELYWQPLGPILAVMPWNFPFWQVVRCLVASVLVGNVVLLKHASLVQGTANLIEEMMNEAGALGGLFQNLAVKSDVISGLIADPRIVAVTLTGSEGAGMAVAEAAGRNLKKVVLELGGSDPFIVMPSANLDEAVKQAVKARTLNAGQSCICAKRMIVHKDIYDSFLEKYLDTMRALKIGDPMNAATDMGPLSSLTQRDTVLGQLRAAQKLGAKLIGGEPLSGSGAFMNAGALIDVPPDSSFNREEIFGPVAIIHSAKNIDDAIFLANDIPFGLGSSVWSEDKKEQERFIQDIEAGMTAINQMLASSPDMPFGGIKRSGFGRELGPYGLHEFMNLKSTVRTAN